MTGPFEIEHDIPIPSPIREGKPPVYPWRKMEIGDSFLVPLDSYSRKAHSRLSTALSQAGRRSGRKFCTRRVEGGIRVWRIE